MIQAIRDCGFRSRTLKLWVLCLTTIMVGLAGATWHSM
jgi:hypothetical protein